MREHTLKDLAIWNAYLDAEMSVPGKTEYYLMQIAQLLDTISRLIPVFKEVNLPDKKLEDYSIKIGRKPARKRAEKKIESTPETRRQMMEWSKSIWLGYTAGFNRTVNMVESNKE